MIRPVVPNISTRWLEESRRFDLALWKTQAAMDLGRILTRYLLQNETVQNCLSQSDEANIKRHDDPG